MATLERLLARLEELLTAVDEFDEPERSVVLELLDGIDTLHRGALRELPAAMGPDALARARAAHPALGFLLDTYAGDGDPRAAAEQALEAVRPYVRSHGGEVEVLDVRDGVVHVRMSGACSGCTASAVTLTEGVERALRDGMPGFAALAVEEDSAPAHPPPGPTLLQIENRL